MSCPIMCYLPNPNFQDGADFSLWLNSWLWLETVGNTLRSTSIDTRFHSLTGCTPQPVALNLIR